MDIDVSVFVRATSELSLLYSYKDIVRHETVSVLGESAGMYIYKLRTHSPIRLTHSTVMYIVENCSHHLRQEIKEIYTTVNWITRFDVTLIHSKSGVLSHSGSTWWTLFLLLHFFKQTLFSVYFCSHDN